LIDLHSHILPEVDDGARTLEEAVEIGRAAAADGITGIAATPHVRDDYQTSAEEMERRVADVREALDGEGVAIELYPGGELALDWLDRLDRDELRRFGLAGNPSFLLVEFPYFGWPLDLAERLFQLRLVGITPVLAHPERNADVQEAPHRLTAVVEAGTLVQVTAASLDGRLGRGPRETGLKLLDLGLAHVLASDAHHPGIRTVGMSAAAEAVGDEQLAVWLTRDVPGAIVAGTRIPERPERARRQRTWLPWR
jgi:protein-tyrosine phosphatase